MIHNFLFKRQPIFTSFRKQSGFTLLELIVVLAIFSTLFGIIITNLGSLQNRSYLSTAVTTFISDFREQQLKAMIGDTEGKSGTDHAYGMYIELTKYTFFHGSSYSSTDAYNFVTNLDGNLRITSPASGTSIVFSQISGEIVGYNPAANTIVIQDQNTGLQKTLQYNRYGVITSVN